MSNRQHIYVINQCLMGEFWICIVNVMHPFFFIIHLIYNNFGCDFAVSPNHKPIKIKTNKNIDLSCFASSCTYYFLMTSRSYCSKLDLLGVNIYVNSAHQFGFSAHAICNLIVSNFTTV